MFSFLQELHIVFPYFNIEFHPNCLWDSVTITDTTCSTLDDTQQQTTICGVRLTYEYLGNGSVMCVKFRSDHVVTKTGFKALVTATSSKLVVPIYCTCIAIRRTSICFHVDLYK